MIEIISSPLVTMAPGSNATPTVPDMATPDALAAARFDELMATTPAAPTSTTLPTLTTPHPQAVTLGDRILQGLGGLSTDFQQSWKEVSSVLDSGNMMTTGDMLKLQMNLTQIAIQYDMVGKAISKSTQNIEQLVKIQ